jgi:iron complex outermembrane recepter protein
VNVILKKNFTGMNVTADAGTSSHADGTTGHLAATYGMGDVEADGHNFYISAEFRHQQQIRFADRGGIFEQQNYIPQGGVNLTNGVPTPQNGNQALSKTGYVVDPATGNIAGFLAGCTAVQYNAGQCTYTDYWDNIQPPTTNYNLLGKFTQKLASDWTLSVQGTYFESKTVVTAAPAANFGNFTGVTSGPGVTPVILPTIPATTISSSNPTFPAGTGITSGLLTDSVLLGPINTYIDSKAYRAIADLDGKIGAWDINASLGYTEVRLNEKVFNGINPANLQTALDSTTAPFLPGQPNSAAVLSFIAPPLEAIDTSELWFTHIGASNAIAPLPGGSLGVAFGADYFQRRQNTKAPPAIEAATQVGISNVFSVGDQHVAAGYVEIDAPVLKQLDFDAAIRYDHYNLSGGKASPKIGFKFTPIPEFALRGTASKGFRAPGPAENGQAGQTFIAGAKPDLALCQNPAVPTAPGNFVGQCSLSTPGLQTTNPALKPETSKSFSLGFIIEPYRDFSTSFDLYSVEIDNQIVAGGPQTLVRTPSLLPIPVFVAGGGTQLVAPPIGPILFFTTSFINANKTFTDGWDLDVDYHHSFDNGWRVKSDINWTYIHEYLLTIGGVNYHLDGTHGPSFFSGDTGNPKSKASWANTIGKGPWSATVTVNYISSFNVTDPSLNAFEPGTPADTCQQALSNEGGASHIYFSNITAAGGIPAATSCNVNHFTTVDFYTKWDITGHLAVHGSVTNLFNTKAPLDWATYGGALGAVPWNPSQHLQGAIGAFFNVGATYNF